MLKRTITFILAFLFIQGSAQNISVSSFKLLDTDLTANTTGTMETDQNGETAALIKVVTTQTGFSFDGGALGIVKTKQTPGEVWVYIPRGSKKISIKHPQLGVLRDYYFPISIEAARTYEMIIATGTVQTIVSEDAGGQYVVMNIDPPTAIVYIDENETTLNNGSLSKFLSYGNHSYRVTDPLYTADAGNFEIGKEKTILNIKLNPAYGVLNITTTPENGAKVFIDNNAEPIGITPFITTKLSKGEHKFRFLMPEYESKSMTYNVHSDGSTQSLIVPLNPNYADIIINLPDKCHLFIDGEDKGEGLWKGRLSEGMYRLEARKAGHASAFQTITVVKGEKQEITMIAPLPIFGSLNVNSTPIGANIYIDDELKGKSPDIINEVLIGNHVIKLVIDGYEIASKDVNIEKGKISDLSFVLEAKKIVNTNHETVSIDKNNYLSASNNGEYIPEKSDGNVLKTILSSKNYYQAENVLNNNLRSLNSQDRAKAYNKLVDLAMEQFDAQSKIKTENLVAEQMGKAGKAVNEDLMTQMAYNALIAAKECDKYDQMPNEKGKVAPKFASKNAKRLWSGPRNQLVNAGQNALTSRDNASARKYWQLFVESDALPLFKECDRTPQQPFFGQVARFAAIFAYQDKDMDKALELAEIAMKDPEERDNALNLKLEIMGGYLKNRSDSVNYSNQLKEMYVNNHSDGIMEKLYNILYGLGNVDEANKILDDALSRNPNNFVALADKGLGLLQSLKYEDAARYLDRAYNVKPDNAMIATYAGTAYSVWAQELKDDNKKRILFEKAVKLFDKAKELDPQKQYSNWGYNRYNAYYNYYGPDSQLTKMAEKESK